MFPISRVWPLLILATTGCRYAGPYVEARDEVQLTWSADPSTTVYAAKGDLGHYVFSRFEGNAGAELAGGETFQLHAGPKRSSRDVAQPLSTASVVLARSGDGQLQLTRPGGVNSDLRFVTGTWEDFVAGRDVVLSLTDPAWRVWTEAIQDAFLALLDRQREAVWSQLDERRQSLTMAEVQDFVVDGVPLIRANRQRLLVFFQALTLEGSFAVVTRRRDPARAWWLSSYEVRPGVRNFFEGTGEFMAAVALMSVRVLLECGRCVGHCH